MKKFFAAILFLTIFGNVNAQLSITNAAPSATINFSSSMQTTVGTNPSTAYEGDGFMPNPTTAGRLNSNAWEVKGWSFGDLLFGGTQTVDDYARGSVTGGVITPGMYAFTESPGTVANPAMLIQPGTGDFAPGTITLKIKNNGTSNLTQIAVSYNLFVHNDENTSSSLNFSHSYDNSVFVNEPLLNYTSPDVADALQWVIVGLAPSRSVVIPGLNIAPGGVYYIRWSCADVSGTGNRDEFGIDDIVVDGTYGAPAPEINVTCYGATLLSGDITPTVGEGTEFAPIFAPLSTLLTTQNISFYIQNLGGLPLNITNVTITGPDAADFTIFGGIPTGSIPAASATISTKQLSIIFDPSAEGLRKARVNIFSNDSDENPYFFDIQGYGIVPIPDIRVNGGPLAGGVSIVTSGSLVPSTFNNTQYAPQTVGVTSQTNDFVIRNDCPYNAPLILTGPAPYVTISGANAGDFTLTAAPLGNTINPGFNKTFKITFAPTGTGIRTALVTILNNDPDTLASGNPVESPFTFQIQGTGVSPEIDIYGNTQPIISGSTVTTFVNHTFFDYLNITSGTLDRTFTIKNNGNAALTISGLAVSGAQAGDFAIITPPAASVAVGATTTFVIRFDPSAVGIRNAVISMNDNDFDENPYTFAISGFGLDYIPCALGILETIAIQDFEAVPATPTWTYSISGSATIAGGTAFGASGDGGFSPRFLGTKSLQLNNGSSTVTMSNVNTTQYNDIELNLKLASLSAIAADGNDLTDRVSIAVSSDGGATWSNELDLQGNLDAKWTFSSGTALSTAVFDNNNIPTSLNPAAGGFLTSTGYGTMSISALPKVASLSIKITLLNNTANEIWAIDNITLFGRKEISTTWTGTVWTPSVPTTTTKVIIDGNYNTGTFGSIHACKCQINAGKNVTINTNTYLDIESDLNNSGNLTIENSASLVQHNDFAVNTGIVNVKRNTTPMRLYDYTYWSSPVNGQTLSALSPATQPDKYYSYNPVTGSWVSILNGAAIMAKGKGYIVRAPQTFNPVSAAVFSADFNGAANNGFIQTPINKGVSSMNLIGNPYPSAINADLFLSNSANIGVVEGTIYLWTHNTPIQNQVYTANDYAVYNFSGSVATSPAQNSGVSNTAPTGKIASGQGFFIKGLINNGQATFINSMRVTGNNSAFLRTSQETGNNQASTIEKHRVWLNLSNDQGAFKQTLVGYIAGATNDYDRGFDGELFNANSYIGLYSIENDLNLAIQGRALPFSENDHVPLGYTSTVAGAFEISIDHVDGLMEAQNIYLEDKLLNITHDLKQSAYPFITEIGTFNSRFELKYINTNLSTTDFQTIDSNLLVTVKDNQINILSEIQNIKAIDVYDIIGREVFQKSVVGTKICSFQNPVRGQQALILKITLENGQVTTRKIVL